MPSPKHSFRASVQLAGPLSEVLSTWPAPVVFLNLPATHSSHAAALVAAGLALTLPASHSWQSPALTEPTTVLYDPAAQSTHRVAPMAALAYVPLAHSVHAAALVAAGVALALPASHCDEEVGEPNNFFALALPPLR